MAYFTQQRTIITLSALMVLTLLGSMLSLSPPWSVDAQQGLATLQIPSTTPFENEAHTATRTPFPTMTRTATPTTLPTATATSTPTPSPTPTPDMTILDARLATDVDLQAAICRPDMKLTLHEGQIAVPIILYHFVGRATLESEGQSVTRYNVTRDDFDAQLALLQRLGYHTVTISEVTAAISGTYALPARPVAITVDDGWIEQYTHIFPMLQKYHMRATFYIPSTYPVGGRFVTWEQVQALSDAGMEIGSHTRTHVDLTTQTAADALYELTGSKHTLEEKLGITITSIAYPYGGHSANVRVLAEQAGYQAAIALGTTPKQSPANRYALNRSEIFGTQPLSEFLKWLPWRGLGTELCPELPTPTAVPKNE